MKLSTIKQFKEARSYLHESRNYVYTIIGIFFLATFFGFLFRANLTFLDELLRDLILRTQDLNTPEITLFILQNNLQSALFSLILGIFLGLAPLFNTLTNGVVLGYVLGIASAEAGFLIWWRLLPHGIFELPAIFISLGLGVKLGFTLFIKRSQVKKELRRRFYNSMNVFLMIVIPLLIIAAIIEGLLIGFT
jgi:stage II sporulation protein M